MAITSFTTAVLPPLSLRGFLDMPQKDPCQKQACEIQKCLQANNYLESKCQAVIQELRKCCARYPKGRSLVCSGFEKEEEENLAMKSGSK
ncbi:cx9C motif-containing protein 4 isoform X1 [Grammomys surdaster]|uniref:cx9C motif-containing protein 4 isoform X1 n=1 Tax=Grammomys surdaster TaxID=491861 RepID=UPI00109FEEB8|nr:cx9C motif-containing protein 4 isoform X1 [Grammomys surdaster]